MKRLGYLKLWGVVALVLPLLTVACSDDDPAEPARVEIDAAGSTVTFTYNDLEPREVSFSTNRAWTVEVPAGSWVSVSPLEGEAGTATLTLTPSEANYDAERSAAVTVRTVDGKAEAVITVVQQAPIEPTSLEIEVPQNRLVKGQTLTLIVKVEPEDAYLPPLVWSSSNSAVVSVDQQGVVTAVEVGEATVTGTYGKLRCDVAFEVTDRFTTDGEGRTYSFADLAALPGSGVTGSEGVYTVSASMTIDEADVLTIADGDVVSLADGVELRVEGMVDLCPATKARIQPVDAESTPKPLYLTGDVKGGGKICNMEIDNCPIRYYGTADLTIEKCLFTGVRSSYSSINLGGSGLTTVEECEFRENGMPSISGGANIASALIFRDNYLYKNSNNTRNRTQINVTVPGDGQLEITGNTVIGPGEVTMNGGIAVANMLGLGGANKVLIENNKVSDCRYGITTNGPMDVRIIGNELIDNKWDSNPMNGGSGVSIYNSAGGQKVYMQGNTIKGHLWGITVIGNPSSGKGPEVNMGNTASGEEHNPGGNVLSDNGNGGVLYDLYNNSPMTVYAQGNTWGVATQDAASIETVIFHKNDNPSLGEVIYLPAAE